jgi:hypothetical protein
MADLLESVRRQLRERLDELRPAVQEYEQLSAAESALLTLGNGTAPNLSRGTPSRVRSPRDAQRNAHHAGHGEPARRARRRGGSGER